MKQVIFAPDQNRNQKMPLIPGYFCCSHLILAAVVTVYLRVGCYCYTVTEAKVILNKDAADTPQQKKQPFIFDEEATTLVEPSFCDILAAGTLFSS